LYSVATQWFSVIHKYYFTGLHKEGTEYQKLN